MKLSIMLSVGVCASLLAYNAYSLTCGAQPSCADLGYSYTGSTTDCVNTPMKCPFNTSYFNCTKKADALSKLKSDMVKLVAPNYNAYQTLNARGTTYTVGSGTLASYSCGWVLFMSIETNPNENPSKWYINSRQVGAQKGLAGQWADYNSAIFFVTSGNTFRLSGTTNDNKDTLLFYPCLGS